MIDCERCDLCEINVICRYPATFSSTSFSHCIVQGQQLMSRLFPLLLASMTAAMYECLINLHQSKSFVNVIKVSSC